MTRLKAFFIHFLLSFIVFLILLYFILVQWYPQPLFSSDGGWHVIRIIIGVDLVLGPLLTLVVFKPGKPGLKFDLSMIALAQTLALSWGMWATYIERPVAIIYTLDFFTPVPAYQLSEQGMTAKKLKQFGDRWPVLIYSDISKEKQQEALYESMQQKIPLYLLTKYYTKFSSAHVKALRQNEILLEKYVADKPALNKLYQRALLDIDPTKTNFIFLGLHSRKKWVTAIFDLDSLHIIGTINIEPSAYTYAQKIKRKPKKEK